MTDRDNPHYWLGRQASQLEEAAEWLNSMDEKSFEVNQALDLIQKAEDAREEVAEKINS